MHALPFPGTLLVDAPTENTQTSMRPMISHEPVMLREALAALSVLGPGGVVVDATVGLGGHAQALLPLIAPGGRYIGIDKDEEALAVVRSRLQQEGVRCDLVHDDFRHLDRVLENSGVETVDAVLFDCGVSSFQLDTPERGFSFQAEGPLDMRMDRHAFISAYDLVNTLTEEELASILYKFGEERFSRRIARALVEARRRAPVATTRQLADIVLRATPFKARRRRLHPATRTFQALRIAVNRELDGLEEAVQKAALCLDKGGRCVVISFHSLEDRIVKEAFRTLERGGRFRRLNKKVVRPTFEEMHRNPRSRSARLRALERIS
ncbi:MAG: 16S rRNA (cytosine(1402)-N(4))-methyltransferase RsmH [Deltaproteobacteria bacterium]